MIVPEKRYLVDTSVLADDPDIISRLLPHNEVIIHDSVLEELDRIKRDPKYDSYAKANARKSLRTLDEFFSNYKEDGGTIRKGEPITVENGLLRVVFPEVYIERAYADPDLITYAQKNSEIILLTEDTRLHLRAQAEGLNVEVIKEKRKGKSIHDLFNIPESIELPSINHNELIKKSKTFVNSEDLGEIAEMLCHNQYLYLEGSGISLRYRHYDDSSPNNHEFTRLITETSSVKGIIPKNKEQEYLLHACLDDQIEVLSVLGKAGTGKTLITLAAALYLCTVKNSYRKILIIRPTSIVGEDLGFLPGKLGQKISPYMAPIYDNAEIIFDSDMRRKVAESEKKKTKKNKPKNKRDDTAAHEVDYEGLNYLIEKGVINFSTLTFSRGRSIPNSVIILDEAQNMTDQQIKTALTRVGPGSKVIINGDPYQIDNPENDYEKNGLVYSAKRFLGQDMFALTILKKGERSRVAELAANLL